MPSHNPPSCGANWLEGAFQPEEEDSAANEAVLEQGAAVDAVEGAAHAAGDVDCGYFGTQHSWEKQATEGFSIVRLKLHVYWNPKVPGR